MHEIASLDQIPDTVKQLEAAFYDIPFENSDFQNKMFVAAEQLTPARAYRAVGLRMFAKIRAIKEYGFALEEQQVDLDEIDYKINLPTTDAFEKRRLDIKKRRLIDARSWSDKLLNDAFRELTSLYAEFDKLPKFTRAQFEQEEHKHFELSLSKQAQITNPGQSSLLTMMHDVNQYDLYVQQVHELLNDSTITDK